MLAPETDVERVNAVVTAWFGSLTLVTARSYRESLTALARAANAAGHPATDAASLALWAVAAPAAFSAWTQAHLLDESAGAPSSRRKRGSAVNGLLKALHRARLAVSALPPELPRRGVGASAAARVASVEWAEHAEERCELVELRTVAMLRLAACGLKSAEVLALRLPDVTTHMPRLCVRGDLVAVAPEAWAALERWVERRGRGPGWLFCAIDGRSGRMRATAVSPRCAERAARKLGYSMSSIRRRRIVDDFDAHGVHHAAAVARICNAADITAAMKSSWSSGD